MNTPSDNYNSVQHRVLWKGDYLGNPLTLYICKDTPDTCFYYLRATEFTLENHISIDLRTNSPEEVVEFLVSTVESEYLAATLEYRKVSDATIQ